MKRTWLYLSIFLSLAVLVSLAPPQALADLSGDNPLTPSFLFTGNLDAALFGTPFLGGGNPSGSVTVSGLPASSSVSRAFFYTNDWQGSNSVSLTFAGNAIGAVAPLSLDAGGTLTLGGYRWDVTPYVTGNGSYPFRITGTGQTYVGALAVVYSDVGLPLQEVRINDGSESMQFTTSTTSFTGVLSGSGKLFIMTQADDSSSGEVISFNGGAVGGPIDANLGSYASIFNLPVTTLAGVNTASITTGADWFGWHVAMLSSPAVVPLPPSVLLFGSGLLGVGLAAWRRK